MESRIETIALSELKPDQSYDLSFPVRTDRFSEFAGRFPGIPGIIINPDRAIVFGIDAYHYHRSRNHSRVTVINIDLSQKQGLFLNFNLKEKLFGLNPYETLIFLKKALALTDLDEIREKTGIQLPVNAELLDRLDLLTGPEFKKILIEDKLHLKTAIRLCALKKMDRQSLIALFDRFHFSRSHQLQIIDWMEELMFRDKTSARLILSKLKPPSLDPSRNPQSIILERLGSLRHPQYHMARKKWQKEIKKLDIPPHLQIHHSPFFEKKEIRLTMTLGDWKTLENLLQKIKK